MRRAYTVVLAPAAIAAAVATGQVALAEATGITTLSDNFWAGGERIVDVQMTLVAYFCATAVVIADTAVPSGQRLRRLRPVAAAVGALAVLPLVAARANEYVGGLGTDAVIAGAVVGAIAAFALTGLRIAAIAVAAHLALLWLATLAFLPFVDPTVVYAGLVQPLGTSVLDDLLGDLLGYHLPTLLPYALASIVLTGALAAWFTRRAAATPESAPPRGPAIRAAAAAPVLAAVLYPVVGVDLWNGEAAPVAAVVAVLGVVAAAAGASWGRRTAPRPAAAGAEPDRTGRRLRPARPPES
jgi:hypothetical protein